MARERETRENPSFFQYEIFENNKPYTLEIGEASFLSEKQKREFVEVVTDHYIKEGTEGSEVQNNPEIYRDALIQNRLAAITDRDVVLTIKNEKGEIVTAMFAKRGHGDIPLKNSFDSDQTTLPTARALLSKDVNIPQKYQDVPEKDIVTVGWFVNRIEDGKTNTNPQLMITAQRVMGYTLRNMGDENTRPRYAIVDVHAESFKRALPNMFSATLLGEKLRADINYLKESDDPSIHHYEAFNGEKSEINAYLIPLEVVAEQGKSSLDENRQKIEELDRGVQANLSDSDLQLLWQNMALPMLLTDDELTKRFPKEKDRNEAIEAGTPEDDLAKPVEVRVQKIDTLLSQITDLLVRSKKIDKTSVPKDLSNLSDSEREEFISTYIDLTLKELFPTLSQITDLLVRSKKIDKTSVPKDLSNLSDSEREEFISTYIDPTLKELFPNDYSEGDFYKWENSRDYEAILKAAKYQVLLNSILTDRQSKGSVEFIYHATRVLPDIFSKKLGGYLATLGTEDKNILNNGLDTEGGESLLYLFKEKTAAAVIGASVGSHLVKLFAELGISNKIVVDGKPSGIVPAGRMVGAKVEKYGRVKSVVVAEEILNFNPHSKIKACPYYLKVKELPESEKNKKNKSEWFKFSELEEYVTEQLKAGKTRLVFAEEADNAKLKLQFEFWLRHRLGEVIKDAVADNDKKEDIQVINIRLADVGANHAAVMYTALRFDSSKEEWIKPKKSFGGLVKNDHKLEELLKEEDENTVLAKITPNIAFASLKESVLRLMRGEIASFEQSPAAANLGVGYVSEALRLWQAGKLPKNSANICTDPRYKYLNLPHRVLHYLSNLRDTFSLAIELKKSDKQK